MALLSQLGTLFENPNLGLARQVGQLLFPREYKISSDDVDVKIDTVISESHESVLNITKYAVEQGADMSDHYVVAPVVFSLSGAVSDISSNEIIDFALTGLASKAFNSVTGQTSGTKSQLAWEQLKALQQSGEFITYVSNLEVYESMLITRLSVKQDVSSSQAIFFDMTLEQVLTADIEVITGVGVFSSLDPTKGKPETKDRMSDLVSGGKKSGVDKTFLSSFTDSFF